MGKLRPGWMIPVKSPMNITDDFDEHKARGSVNPGTDFAKPVGTRVYAASNGVVTLANRIGNGSGGKMIIIAHGSNGSVVTQYLHLSGLNVKSGQRVRKGDVIGWVGGSGYGKPDHYGAHLHWSLQVGKKNVDPMEWVTV